MNSNNRIKLMAGPLCDPVPSALRAPAAAYPSRYVLQGRKDQ